MRCRQGTKNCHESRARFRGKRKAAQFCIPRLREPCHEAPAACGAQRLLRSPERIPVTGRSHHCKVAEVNAGRRQPGRIGNMRRGKPHDALARAGKSRERRQEKLQFADAFCVGENLGEHARGPPSARQLGIEWPESRGNCRHRGKGGRAAPDGLALQDFSEIHDTVFIYSISVRRKAVKITCPAA